MADSANTQKQKDKTTVTAPFRNNDRTMLNKIVNLPVETPSQTKDQPFEVKHHDLSNAPQSHPQLDPFTSSSQGTRASEAGDHSVDHQPQSHPPMSFTSQPLGQANTQTHLRGGCDDESCDCCCCAYTRFGPPPQPLYHRLWYGKPGMG